MDTSVSELYKSYVGDLGNVGSRYAAANGFYLSVASALLGLLVFVEPGEAPADISFFIGMAIPAFGIVICWIWHKTINFYNKLFLSKFDVLKQAEDSFPFKFYQIESHRLFEVHKAKPLTENEKRVPLTLGILFACMFAANLYFILVSSAPN